MADFNLNNSWISRRSDILLAGVMVLIIAMLVIRLPPQMLDVLLACNIAAAATVLFVALYIPNASKIASFPTILLLTTLFRLALNVSSTRLILLDAYAGEVINAFGEFVVQGNFVVGGVIFLILVVIQFVVIAKGSERVAEVAARFTLDAMPGKQMAIDNDLRSGIVDQAGATARRKALEKESQLYGAMDGAMKFVKGDAIAGIIISLVNIVGGLIIGVMQQGMTLADAAQTYSLLTIGDGLVSQIPALLLSVSAGLVVTRVASGEGDDAHVAKDIFDQIVQQPRALACVSVLLCGIALVPGFPWYVFLTLGIFFGSLSFPRLMSPDAALAGGPGVAVEGGPGAPAPELEGEAAPSTETLPPHPQPVVLELHSSITQLLAPGNDESERRAFENELREIRERLYQDMGLPYPPVQTFGNCAHLPENAYSLLIYECPVASCAFSPDQALAVCEEKDVRALGVEPTPARLPWSHIPACLVPADQTEPLRQQGLRVLGARDVILQHLVVTLRRHSAEFLGIQEARSLLDNLEENFPALVQEVVPKNLNMQQVTGVLQRLLEEEVPIRDMRQIMGSLARWSQSEKDPSMLTELVRRDMKRLISTRYAGGGNNLGVYLVDPSIEDLIRDSVTQQSGSPVLSLPPEATTDVLAAVGRCIESPRNLSQTPVILADASVRRFLRKLVDLQYPEAVVLSYDELTPELHVRSLGRISLDDESA